MSKRKFLSWISLFVVKISTIKMSAQESTSINKELNAKWQSLASISALTALGEN